MKTVTLPTGEAVPALGQGTWFMGGDPASRRGEIAVLQQGMDLGLKLIDTAEMYGDGRTEALLGEALRGRRDEAFLVSKVSGPHSAFDGVIAACEASLRRLDTDRLDLYLLHWRGGAPLAETLEAFLALQRDGKIRHYGVSNLDTRDMQDLWSIPGGAAVATDQVLYNLKQRGIEWGLLPWLREHGIPVMAYSPFEHAGLLDDNKLQDFARDNRMTPAQVALAWLLANDDIIAIPKTASAKRMQENAGALEQGLSWDQMTELDHMYPPPSGPQSLAVR